MSVLSLVRLHISNAAHGPDIHIPCLTPLLLLAVVIQLDRANVFTDPLQSYASACSTNPVYSFVRESWFHDFVKRVRDNSYLTFEDGKMGLVQIVSVSLKVLKIVYVS